MLAFHFFKRYVTFSVVRLSYDRRVGGFFRSLRLVVHCIEVPRPTTIEQTRDGLLLRPLMFHFAVFHPDLCRLIHYVHYANKKFRYSREIFHLYINHNVEFASK